MCYNAVRGFGSGRNEEMSEAGAPLVAGAGVDFSNLPSVMTPASVVRGGGINIIPQ